MGMLKLDGVTHWSIPVNDLEEAEKFYKNMSELRDATWKSGMPKPTFEEIVRS